MGIASGLGIRRQSKGFKIYRVAGEISIVRYGPGLRFCRWKRLFGRFGRGWVVAW